VKSLASILLIFTFVLPLAVPYTVLQYQKKAIKRKVKWMMIAGLDEQDLVHLTFSKAESAQLDWKHSTEFAFEGELYDVVRTYERGDQIIYICWHDHEETALYKDLDQLLVNYFKQAPESNRTKARTALFLKSLIAIETGVELPRLHPSNRQVENLKPYMQMYYSVHLGTHTPPPRQV
jgi:hypothetical protein